MEVHSALTRRAVDRYHLRVPLLVCVDVVYIIILIVDLVTERPLHMEDQENQKKQFKLLKCSCGWCHFGMTKSECQTSVDEFNRFFDAATDEVRGHYGNKKVSIADYQHCFFCGRSYTNFVDAKPGDCPDGCTLQPIQIHDSNNL